MIHRSVIPRTRLAAVLLVTLAIFGGDPCSSALQYQSIDPYTSGSECALVLDGPGRSSAFDYTYNLLRGSFPPSAGSQTCITYDAVNHAYIEARKRINVAQPNTESWRGEDLATVGELLLDISVNLAQKYGLTYDDIEKGLPLIDTSKTLIREICPAFLSDVECRPGKYRRYDGLCTNLENPTWGAANTPFTRLLPPKFADGINAPRISVTGNQLPLARVVSRTMHPDDGFHDHAGTVMIIAWGQFMDHDYTLTATPLDATNRNDPEECCNRPPHLKNPYCNEILIPEDDYFYRLFNVRCMNFVRGFPAPRPGCRLGSRVPFNLLTGVLDGNTVYGISEDFSRKLRTGYGGLLRMNPVFSEYGLKDLLPLKLDIPDEGCTRPNKSMYCFDAGEIRVNEQLVLTCMHTLMAREHNRAANALAQVNPHWDDETIFQEARRIVIAEIQHVTYNEFLPILLGKEVMEKFGLLLEKDGYWDGYDSTVNPGVIDAFAAAAYRFGHSLLPTAVERWSKAHKFIASKRLSDLIRRPYDLYRAGVLDEYFMGLMNQVAQAMDDSITQEVTNHLFKKVGAKFGMDLVSFNMQRGREVGIPSYMEFRKFCGLPGADNFEELLGSMPNETIRRYSSIFEHPSDVDLWSGGVSERPLPGSMLGPTFACVIATQFSYSRRGDRFWYELPNQPSSFTPEQLVEIRKSRLSRLICDNTDLIDTIQLYPMVLPDHEINPRVPCRSGVLPSIDFSKWAEFPSGRSGNAAEYNFLGAWLPPLKVMPPLAYARFPETIKRKLDTKSSKKKTFNLADLIGNARRSAESVYMKKFMKNQDQSEKSNLWPALMIKKSTEIVGEIPAEDILQRNEIDMPINPAGYFLEKSEIEISPMNNIFREKRYSIKTLFDDFSKRGVTRFRRKIGGQQPRNNDEEVNLEGLDQAENISRLLAILAPNHEEESLRKGSFGHRSKRQISEDEASEPIEEPEEEMRERVTSDDSKHRGNGRRKPQYTPVFNECNDTAASEISDLNAPPPPPERRTTLQEYSRNGGQFPKDIDFAPKKNPSIYNRKKNAESLEIPVLVPPTVDEEEVVEAPKETASTLKNSQNATYINLQDHQKGTHDGNVPKDANGYPLDIAPYNPDVIPYVDVPDYSDQREESLDKDDRRVAKEKYVEYPDDDADIIDPGVPVESDKRSEKIIVRDDDVLDNDEVAEDPVDSKSPGAEEVNEEKEEEEHENEEQKEEEREEEEDGGSFHPSSDHENAQEDKEHEETNSKDIRNSESADDLKDYEPIHFDIEEYKKPFNLEELFKDIERDAQKAQGKNKTKEKDVNEHQSSKNIPVREDSHEAINGASGKYKNDGEFKFPSFEEPAKKENYENRDNSDRKNSHEDGTIAPPNFFEEFERVFGPAISETPFKVGYFDTEEHKEGLSGSPSAGSVEDEHEKYPYGSEDTYERLFGGKNERDKPQDEDTYKQHSDDDASLFDGEKKNPETKGEESTDESLLEPYKTLSSILDRKDDISRLDDEVAEKAKKEGKMPPKYNNYWTLEYGSPAKEGKT